MKCFLVPSPMVRKIQIPTAHKHKNKDFPCAARARPPKENSEHWGVFWLEKSLGREWGLQAQTDEHADLYLDVVSWTAEELEKFGKTNEAKEKKKNGQFRLDGSVLQWSDGWEAFLNQWSRRGWHQWVLQSPQGDKGFALFICRPSTHFSGPSLVTSGPSVWLKLQN